MMGHCSFLKHHAQFLAFNMDSLNSRAKLTIGIVPHAIDLSVNLLSSMGGIRKMGGEVPYSV